MTEPYAHDWMIQSIKAAILDVHGPLALKLFETNLRSESTPDPLAVARSIADDLGDDGALVERIQEVMLEKRKAYERQYQQIQGRPTTGTTTQGGTRSPLASGSRKWVSLVKPIGAKPSGS